jgi:hypothetical protein
MTIKTETDNPTVHRHGYCILGCGHDGPNNGDPKHGPYCERMGAAPTGSPNPGGIASSFGARSSTPTSMARCRKRTRGTATRIVTECS